MKIFTDAFFLKGSRWLLFLLIIVAGANVLVTLGDSLTANPTAVGAPDDLVTMRLELNKPYRFPFQDVLDGSRDGWGDSGPAARHRTTTPADTVAPNLAGSYELVPDASIRYLRYREPVWGRRVALHLLGAVPGTTSLLVAVGIVLTMVLVWQLLANLQPDTPFTAANTARLRKLAFLALGWMLAQQASHAVLALLVRPHGSFAAIPLSRYVHLSGDEFTPGLLVFSGLALLMLLYRRGVMLQQEAELTV